VLSMLITAYLSSNAAPFSGIDEMEMNCYLSDMAHTL